jgi:NAD(P)-dependent dehydrogenase (short-subunit alcohol dehydrogenase family)
MSSAIVTGSDSGIGRATAVALAGRGFDVGVTYNRDEQGARETADEVEAAGQRAEVAHLDLSALPGCAKRIDEPTGRPGDAREIAAGSPS